MGMPGSETALEELMCRVLGDLVAGGIVVKLANDLYCGGNTPTELYHNFAMVLKALHKNSLNLGSQPKHSLRRDPPPSFAGYGNRAQFAPAHIV